MLARYQILYRQRMNESYVWNNEKECFRLPNSSTRKIVFKNIEIQYGNIFAVFEFVGEPSNTYDRVIFLPLHYSPIVNLHSHFEVDFDQLPEFRIGCYVYKFNGKLRKIM